MEQVYVAVVKTTVIDEITNDTDEVSCVKRVFASKSDADTWITEQSVQLRVFGFKPHGSNQMFCGNVVIDLSWTEEKVW